MNKHITTKESASELEMRELLLSMSETTQNQFITHKSAIKLIEAGYKLLEKVKELRVSRDNWRNRCKILTKPKDE